MCAELAKKTAEIGVSITVGCAVCGAEQAAIAQQHISHIL